MRRPPASDGVRRARRAAGPWRRTGAAGLAVLALLLAGTADAQTPLRLRRNGGEVGGAIESLGSRDERGHRSEPPRSRLWLRLPLEGTVGAPQWFTWSGSLRPSLLRGPAGEGGSVRVTEMGYEASARLLPGAPFSMTGVVARTRGQSRRDGVTLSELGSDLGSLAASARLPGLALRGEWGDRRSDQSWRVSTFAPPIDQAVRMRTWRLEGSNSKLQFWHQHERRTGPGATDDYLTDATGASHALRWGHGSELASHVTRDAQRRPGDTGQWEWSERVRLRHSPEWESSWSRDERHAWDRGLESHALGWSVRVAHRPGAGFRWGGAYQERRATAAGERSVTRTGGPELAYGTRLPGGVRADASLGFELERRRVDGEPRGAVAVLDERAVFDASGSILLLRAGVRAASLRVESPDHTVLYLEGVDYRTLPGGSTFQVLLLPGGRLRTGDAVLLSYTFDPPTGGAADAHTLRWNLVTGWNGFTGRWSLRRRDAEGSGIAVTARTSAYDEQEAELDWDRTTRMGRAHAAVTHTRRNLDGLHQRVSGVRGEWSAPPTRWGQPSVAGGWSRRTGEGAVIDLDDASAAWTVMPAPSLTTALRVEMRHSRFDHQPLERTTGASLDLDWRFASVESQLRYGFAARRDGVDRDAQRLLLRLTRRF